MPNGFGNISRVKVKSQNPKSIERPLHVLTLSAKSEAALKELAQNYADFLASNPRVSLADVCFSANTRRSHFNYCLAVLAESTVQLRERLLAFSHGRESAEVLNSKVNRSNPPQIAFLFPDWESQYLDTGYQLYQTQPTFRQILDRCDEILRPYLDRSLLEILYLQGAGGHGGHGGQASNSS